MSHSGRERCQRLTISLCQSAVIRRDRIEPATPDIRSAFDSVQQSAHHLATVLPSTSRFIDQLSTPNRGRTEFCLKTLPSRHSHGLHSTDMTITEPLSDSAPIPVREPGEPGTPGPGSRRGRSLRVRRQCHERGRPRHKWRPPSAGGRSR